MNNTNKNNLLISMLVLGSVCGLIEVAVKGMLNYYGIHLSGLIIGLDFIIIGIALAVFKKPLMILGMGLIACLSKQLVVPLLGLSFTCQANSCLAIMLEFGAFAGVAALTLNKMKTSTNARILTAGIGIFMSSVLFYAIGMHVKPCLYLLSFNIAGGFTSFLIREGIVWTIFSALFFPLGWTIGEKIGERISVLSLQRPRLFYAGAGLISVFCWLACGVVIYAGI